MSVAADLQEAADFAQGNVYEKFDAGSDLRALLDSFNPAFAALFVDDVEPQRTVLNWLVPLTQVQLRTPPGGPPPQTVVNVADIADVLFRTMSAAAQAESAGRINSTVAGFLLALYNATWG